VNLRNSFIAMDMHAMMDVSGHQILYMGLPLSCISAVLVNIFLFFYLLINHSVVHTVYCMQFCEYVKLGKSLFFFQIFFVGCFQYVVT